MIQQLFDIAPEITYPLEWYWKANELRRIYRKGQRCRIVVNGTRNNALIEFEDGFKVVASRRAVRAVTPVRAESE